VGGHAYLGTDGAIAPYPGPIGVILSTGLLGQNYAPLAQASSLCGACKDACPVDIDLPKLLLRIRAGELPAEAGAARPARAGQGLPGLLKLALGAYSRLAAHPRLFLGAQKLAGWLCRPLPALMPLPAASGWGYSKHFPKPAAQPFRSIHAGIDEPPSARPAELPAQPAPGERPLAHALAGPDFIRELEAVGGQVQPVSAAELPQKLIAFLRERGLTRVQAWDELPLVSLNELRAAGVRVQHTHEDQVQAGLTGALAGITHSGTLVIPGGAGRSLSVSLVPPVHIAILMRESLVDTLEEALRLPEVTRAPASVLVTGPSRTADIEMSLTIGMHGPRELHVFLVDATPGR
jgi:L-lactate utilization protein LutC